MADAAKRGQNGVTINWSGSGIGLWRILRFGLITRLRMVSGDKAEGLTFLVKGGRIYGLYWVYNDSSI